MQHKLPIIYVSAAVLEKADGTVFLVQRPLDKEMGGLWEIPGGKIEPFETPEETLVRELKEELGLLVRAEDLEPLIFVSHQYEKFHLVMMVFVCRYWQGEITLLEQQISFEWVHPSKLADYLMPDADKPLITVLKKRVE